jgi:ATP-dependent RNA helicase SUPV3L1/SUV3
VASQVAALDRTDGDADVLLGRIAGIRTWTYVSHRADWVADPEHWQQRTRQIEDRLSDALHERLTERFVDRRAAVIARHDPGELIVEVGEGGVVLVQGLHAGRLDGFHFVPDPSARESARGLVAAANRALREDIGDRVEALTREPDAAFTLGDSGQVFWRGAPLARLQAGEDLLSPRIEARHSELLDPPLKDRIRRRLAAWLVAHLQGTLGPLLALREAPLSGAARGLAFALLESLGTQRRRRVAAQVSALTPAERRRLAGLHVTIGREVVFVSSVLGPQATRLRAQHFGIRHDRPRPAVPSHRPSFPMAAGLDVDLCLACGFVPVAGRAIRADRLERAVAQAYRQASRGPFRPGADLASVLGCAAGEVASVLGGLGYVVGADGTVALRGERRRRA